jgi:hypothetical protein
MKRSARAANTGVRTDEINVINALTNASIARSKLPKMFMMYTLLLVRLRNPRALHVVRDMGFANVAAYGIS